MSSQEPAFRIVRGTPTAEEVAALVGALFTRTRPASPAGPPAASAWVRSSRPGAVAASGMPARRGADAWRTSGRPV
ncbi:acyl-CoA carboxylase epsilon subunit [Micromonospora sonneratiae]|uniref:Acyl-CoA carboxylase epsilon subunit n=1 Tax=Micromonospora sonneratiae TaxID=1184706 RepID=A0ABW3YI92_9ACTN